MAQGLVMWYADVCMLLFSPEHTLVWNLKKCIMNVWVLTTWGLSHGARGWHFIDSESRVSARWEGVLREGVLEMQCPLSPRKMFLCYSMCRWHCPPRASIPQPSWCHRLCPDILPGARGGSIVEEEGATQGVSLLYLHWTLGMSSVSTVHRHMQNTNAFLLWITSQRQTEFLKKENKTKFQSSWDFRT